MYIVHGHHLREERSWCFSQAGLHYSSCWAEYQNVRPPVPEEAQVREQKDVLMKNLSGLDKLHMYWGTTSVPNKICFKLSIPSKKSITGDLNDPSA